ncbi:MAG TPA: ribonuclease Z [Bacteroidales bacterium]|nr:ribonuclease Z [Bacteroidales bacterium]
MTFELTILGSSAAVPTSKRNLTAHVLNVHERFFLIDCGEGAQLQLRKNNIRFGKIDHIFISHMHGDHIFGLFGLISTFNLLNRKNDLHIYAYHEIEKILESHIAYFERNMLYKIVYHNINPKKNELIFENDKLTVHTIPLKHKVPTCGFLFREKEHLRNLRKNVVETYQIPIKQIQLIKEGNDFINDDGELIPNEKLTLPPYKIRSYAYCTDTAYSEKIVPIIENVDLLFHEATLAKNLQKQAKETTHSTSTDAATIAKKANVKKLIIGHFSARYKDVSLLLQQAQEIFPNTFAAEDGEKYSIELSR